MEVIEAEEVAVEAEVAPEAETEEEALQETQPQELPNEEINDIFIFSE